MSLRLSILMLLISLPSFGQELGEDHALASKLVCRSYLRTPNTDGANLPILFYLYGTGVHTTYSMHPVVRSFANRAAVLTFDKPGIRVENKQIRWDEAQYRQHRQSDLVKCALRAIRWAVTRPSLKGDTPIIFIGHSEGAQILIRTYQALFSDSPEISRRINLMQFSGIPLGPWKTLIHDQIQDEKEAERFWAAFENGDEEYFMSSAGRVPMGYLKEVLEMRALTDNLKELAAMHTQVKIELHHGLNDCQTCYRHLKQFETWNQMQAEMNMPFINLVSYTYNAGHHLIEARDEVIPKMKKSVETALLDFSPIEPCLSESCPIEP